MFASLTTSATANEHQLANMTETSSAASQLKSFITSTAAEMHEHAKHVSFDRILPEGFLLTFNLKW